MCRSLPGEGVGRSEGMIERGIGEGGEYILVESGGSKGKERSKMCNRVNALHGPCGVSFGIHKFVQV